MYEMKVKGKFMNVVLVHRWAVRQKKFGPNHQEILRRNMKKDLTWRTIILNRIFE